MKGELMIYLDNASTTRLDKSVLDQMLPYLTEEYGNPSAIYKLAKTTHKAVEEARAKVAKILNCEPAEIYFTASGSESDNTAIKGIARRYQNKGKHIITSKIEHPAVLETCKALEREGFEVTYISVDENGILNLKELEKSVREDTVLISVMFANNEIGTLQPVKEIGEIAKKHGVYFHTDAVQAVGSELIDVKALGIDALSLSAHKFHGPKGVGALYVKQGVRFERFVDGGHQEKGRRAGTENVAGIVGLAAAMELAYKELEEKNKRVRALRDYYEAEVEKRIPYIKRNGDKQKRLAGTSNISFEFIEGEGLLLNLDIKGICASSGSACTSGSLDPSHVLLAIGLKHEIAHGSLRISIGKYNTKEEIDFLVESLVEIVNKLREMSPLYERVTGGN
ncbi:MAG: cysteine desulfurase NifS [Clostridia bacterium]|nr:cysteine desulfurase NifS [Clostridia bacterium]